jgi:DUF971 family protein
MKKKRAVIVSLEKVGNRAVRISLDDIVQSNDTTLWAKDVLYTCKEYDSEVFENLEFDDKELADFGYSIIARLYTFFKDGEI